MSEKISTDFRGLPLVDQSYSYRSQFVAQKPITDLVPYLENAFSAGVKAIKWQQFIPGSNDGEPCTFTIHDVFFTSNQKVADAWAEDQGCESVLDDSNDFYLEDYAYALASYTSEHPDGLTTTVDVPVDSAEFEYAIRAEFGDNVTIVITPESTYTFDYECGY